MANKRALRVQITELKKTRYVGAGAALTRGRAAVLHHAKLGVSPLTWPRGCVLLALFGRTKIGKAKDKRMDRREVTNQLKQLKVAACARGYSLLACHTANSTAAQQQQLSWGVECFSQCLGLMLNKTPSRRLVLDFQAKKLDTGKPEEMEAGEGTRTSEEDEGDVVGETMQQ